MTRNELDRETSPYLRQHMDNPVHWQAWGEDAFAHARHDDKPVLLSVGYAACHWCHVMAHESFEQPEIAALMNELFVNIKVDREERPDVDAIYQHALALTGQQGGWPLTMFLTPDGEPFWGGTYFPAEPRYGRPGFPAILRRVSEVYHTDPGAVTENTRALVDALGKLARPTPADGPLPVTPDLLNQVAQQLAREVDPFTGGIGSAPKFPQPYAFALLWRAYLRTGQTSYCQAVTTTLTQMCQGGIYDHLGGGFARYSTDDRWLAPHFEKMLYDNAQLIELLVTVWQATRDPLYAERIRETAGWVLREMVAEGGGFAATLDADSEGEEGRFYVWTETEIDRLLGSGASFFKQIYDVTPEGNWDGKTILNRSAHLERLSPEREAELADARAILFRARAGRVRPGWDDKVLADWNGLMIAALANAGAVLDEPAWIAAAQRAHAFVLGRMTADGRLCHSFRNGQRKPVSMLDDYADMSHAALMLHEITGDPEPLSQAEAWVEILNRHYWDDRHGGYFFTADDAAGLITRQRHCHDNAVPSGNGVMVGVLARLWFLTGDGAYRTRVERLIDAFSGELRRNFFPMTTFLNNAEFLHDAVQIVIAGRRGEPATDALIRAVHRVSVPNRLLQVVAPDQALPADHPATGKGQIEGRPTAYVCVGATCSLPITDADELAAHLARPTGA